MRPHFLAIDLPRSIKSQLASLCYGLPSVRWVEEENFHLTLRYLGSLNDASLPKVKDHLDSLFFHPSKIVLKEVGHFHSRDHGVIWVGVESNPELTKLKTHIDTLLKGLDVKPNDRAFQPHITLGRYEKLSSDRLKEYLAIHSLYRSEAIEVTTCSLLCSQQTAKHTLYQEIERYEASPYLDIGDD